MSRILRVFPRRTKATPTGDCVRIGGPRRGDDADKVLVSVAFTWDIPEAERIAEEWSRIAPTGLGGPALGTVGGDFVPGQFLGDGYTITSRGCPERCWFCMAWKRDGDSARELPIRDGHNILDDNLLACSEGHIRAVFAMLARQKKAAQFTGGIHAERLCPWHMELFASLRPRPTVFLAYDEEKDLEPFRVACGMFREAGWTAAGHRLRSYVLCGYPRDTHAEAENRMRTVLACGATPMAMVYRGPNGIAADGWRPWARQWIRPAIIHARKETEEGEG